MKIANLLPGGLSLRFQTISMKDGRVNILLASRKKSAHCPLCGRKSKGVHSTYNRYVADLPWSGIPVCMELVAHKFFCRNSSCPRKIFTERLGAEISPYARGTKRLAQQLAHLGLISGANGGATLAGFLGLRGSASTILRQVRRLPEAAPHEAPRVVGIDDWAFRKGHTYGTIVVDLERRKPIALLPDREPATVARWLESHPSIEIISRDRADAYAQAAKNGSPDAVQIADRWHLLKNLSDALKRMLDKHHKALRAAATELASAKRAQQDEAKALNNILGPIPANPPEETPSQAPDPTYLSNFQEVKRLQAQGIPVRAIARQTGLHRGTVKRYLSHDTYPMRSAPLQNPAPVYAYEQHLKSRWEEGVRNSKELWREIVQLGFKGSFQSVYRFSRQFVQGQAEERSEPPLQVRLWSARRVSLLLGKPSEELTEEESIFAQGLFKACPLIERAARLGQKFKQMAKNRQANQLDEWMKEAADSDIEALKNFAKGLKQDYDAVKAALTYEWSNGQVEGHVNRLKTIKRQMYGRAGFSLLKKRILLHTG